MFAMLMVTDRVAADAEVCRSFFPEACDREVVLFRLKDGRKLRVLSTPSPELLAVAQKLGGGGVWEERVLLTALGEVVLHNC